LNTVTNNKAIPPAPTAPLVSAPTNHEVAGFMPGRLEFEHEVDNEAEIPVKDMEFGLVYKYGGDQQPAAKPSEVKPAEEEEEEEEEEKEVKEEEEEEDDEKPLAKANGTAGGKKKGKEKSKAKEKEKEKDEEEEEAPGEDVVEDEDELEVKLALMEIYFSKLDKREEAKDLIFDRCLTDYKKVCLIIMA
jgi:transcriptional adapter 2-alpha